MLTLTPFLVVPGVQTSRVRELQRRDPDLSDLIQ